MAHACQLDALGRSMQLLTSGHKFVQVDEAVLVAVDQHEQRPNVLFAERFEVENKRKHHEKGEFPFQISERDRDTVHWTFRICPMEYKNHKS